MLLLSKNYSHDSDRYLLLSVCCDPQRGGSWEGWQFEEIRQTRRAQGRAGQGREGKGRGRAEPGQRCHSVTSTYFWIGLGNHLPLLPATSDLQLDDVTSRVCLEKKPPLFPVPAPPPPTQPDKTTSFTFLKARQPVEQRHIGRGDVMRKSVAPQDWGVITPLTERWVSVCYIWNKSEPSQVLSICQCLWKWKKKEN